jgi:diacylglycerol kinase family enzyme
LHVILFHNPTAGDEEHSAHALCALVRGAGHDVVYRSTEEPGWERALDEDGHLIAIAGGDGTVGKVLRASEERPRPVTLLPVGSANNIAQALGFAGRELAELVEGWSRATTRPYRLGEVAGSERRPFAESVGGGLFAEAIVRAGKLEEDETDKVDLGLHVLRELVGELEARPWELELDGQSRGGRFLAVEAMAIGWTGPSVPLAPEADAADGVLHVALVSELERPALASYLDDRLRGHDPAPPAVPVARCTRARLVPPAAEQLRVDDAPWRPSEAAALTVTVAGTAAYVLVPPLRARPAAEGASG